MMLKMKSISLKAIAFLATVGALFAAPGCRDKGSETAAPADATEVRMNDPAYRAQLDALGARGKALQGKVAAANEAYEAAKAKDPDSFDTKFHKDLLEMAQAELDAHHRKAAAAVGRRIRADLAAEQQRREGGAGK